MEATITDKANQRQIPWQQKGGTEREDGRILTLPPRLIAIRRADLRSGAFLDGSRYLPSRCSALRCQDAPREDGCPDTVRRLRRIRDADLRFARFLRVPPLAEQVLGAPGKCQEALNKGRHSGRVEDGIPHSIANMHGP